MNKYLTQKIRKYRYEDNLIIEKKYVKYEPGDILYVLPKNSRKKAIALCKRLNISTSLFIESIKFCF